ncbi:hypothetical protein LJR118_004446 [Acidovorax sp. LjRoot118]|uniref:hypothetical protein n=1 Tax=Acidovorax sp. LjRoot118 TaxID=3342256 RepID=UPI003ECEBF5E
MQLRIALVIGIVLFAGIAQKDSVAPVHLVAPCLQVSAPDPQRQESIHRRRVEDNCINGT